MSDWLDQLARRLAEGEPTVRVTVVAARGSVPRDTGTSMLIGADTQWGTVGGGHLEWNATQTARALLERMRHGAPGAPGGVSRRDRYALGASLGQCCGGAMELAFECFMPCDREFLDAGLRLRSLGGPILLAARWRGHERVARGWLRGASNEASLRAELGLDALQAPLEDTLLAAGYGDPRARLVNLEDRAHRPHLADPQAAQALTGQSPTAVREELWLERGDVATVPLWIYGAGHVAHALVQVLEPLPFSIHWIDNRDAAFEKAPPGLRVERTVTDDPAHEAKAAPGEAIHLVMTHDHDLDYAISRALLERGTFRRFGLIGSETKARRFRQRLLAQGFTPADLARMTSPIGVTGIHSKLPAAIAVATAAQLLQWIECPSSEPEAKPAPADAALPISALLKVPA